MNKKMGDWPSELNVSEARRLLPSLIHFLERHPDRIFKIKQRQRMVAQLQAPPRLAKSGLAAERLLRLAKKRRSKKISTTIKPLNGSSDQKKAKVLSTRPGKF
ncbi:MAG: hypothetical protein HY401_04445 [Elusimicrobia bacterium]|nr:hypothetical protein [Elusimicrobiota bacterium]